MPGLRDRERRDDYDGPRMSFGRLGEIAQTASLQFPAIPYTFDRTAGLNPDISNYAGAPFVRNRTFALVRLTTPDSLNRFTLRVIRSRNDIERDLLADSASAPAKLFAFIPHEYDALGRAYDIEQVNLGIDRVADGATLADHDRLKLDFQEPIAGEETTVLTVMAQILYGTDGVETVNADLFNFGYRGFDPAQGRVFQFQRPADGWAGVFEFWPDPANDRDIADPFALDNETTVKIGLAGPGETDFASILAAASQPERKFWCRPSPVPVRIEELTLSEDGDASQAASNNWIDLTIADVGLARDLQSGGIVIYADERWSVTAVSIAHRRNRAALRCRRII